MLKWITKSRNYETEKGVLRFKKSFHNVKSQTLTLNPLHNWIQQQSQRCKLKTSESFNFTFNKTPLKSHRQEGVESLFRCSLCWRKQESGVGGWTKCEDVKTSKKLCCWREEGKKKLFHCYKRLFFIVVDAIKIEFNLHKKAIKSFSSTTFPSTLTITVLTFAGAVASPNRRVKKLTFFYFHPNEKANLLQRILMFHSLASASALSLSRPIGRPQPQVRSIIVSIRNSAKFPIHRFAGSSTDCRSTTNTNTTRAM